MGLFSTIFLSVGVALMFVVMGLMHEVIGAIPAWFMVVGPCILLFASCFTKHEEDIVLMPFAAAGALFSFGRGLTTGVGVLVLAFALVQFLKIKEKSGFEHRSTWPDWIIWRTASAICVLVPFGLTRLCSALFLTQVSLIILLLCGASAYFFGVYFPAFYFSKKAKR